MKNYYELLGIDPTLSQEELEAKLMEMHQNERWKADHASNRRKRTEAYEKLELIEEAMSILLSSSSEKSSQNQTENKNKDTKINIEKAKALLFKRRIDIKKDESILSNKPNNKPTKNETKDKSKIFKNINKSSNLELDDEDNKFFEELFNKPKNNADEKIDIDKKPKEIKNKAPIKKEGNNNSTFNPNYYNYSNNTSAVEEHETKEKKISKLESILSLILEIGVIALLLVIPFFYNEFIYLIDTANSLIAPFTEIITISFISLCIISWFIKSNNKIIKTFFRTSAFILGSLAFMELFFKVYNIITIPENPNIVLKFVIVIALYLSLGIPVFMGFLSAEGSRTYYNIKERIGGFYTVVYYMLYKAVDYLIFDYYGYNISVVTMLSVFLLPILVLHIFNYQLIFISPLRKYLKTDEAKTNASHSFMANGIISTTKAFGYFILEGHIFAIALFVFIRLKFFFDYGIKKLEMSFIDFITQYAVPNQAYLIIAFTILTIIYNLISINNFIKKPLFVIYGLLSIILQYTFIYNFYIYFSSMLSKEGIISAVVGSFGSIFILLIPVILTCFMYDKIYDKKSSILVLTFILVYKGTIFMLFSIFNVEPSFYSKFVTIALPLITVYILSNYIYPDDSTRHLIIARKLPEVSKQSQTL